MSNDATQEADLPSGGVLSEPVKPCGCLSFGEDCDKCRIHPVTATEDR